MLVKFRTVSQAVTLVHESKTNTCTSWSLYFQYFPYIHTCTYIIYIYIFIFTNYILKIQSKQYSGSELWRHIPDSAMTPNKTIPQGASTSMYCCVAPEIQGGSFYDDCTLSGTASYAADMNAASKLWNISVERTKL